MRLSCQFEMARYNTEYELKSIHKYIGHKDTYAKVLSIKLHKFIGINYLKAFSEKCFIHGKPLKT